MGAVGTDTIDFGIIPKVVGTGALAGSGAASPVFHSWTHVATEPGMLLVAVAFSVANTVTYVDAGFDNPNAPGSVPRYNLRRLLFDNTTNMSLELWVLDAQGGGTFPAGTFTIRVGHTGSEDPSCLSVTVKDTSGVHAFASAKTNSATTPPDVVVTARESDLVIDFAFIQAVSVDFTPGAGQTELLECGASLGAFEGAADSKPGAASSVTMSQTDTNAVNLEYIHMAVSMLCLPTEEASKTVTTSGLSPTSYIEAWIQHGDTTADNGVDEHEELAINGPFPCKYLSATTFEVKMHIKNALALGIFKFRFTWSD